MQSLGRSSAFFVSLLRFLPEKKGDRETSRKLGNECERELKNKKKLKRIGNWGDWIGLGLKGRVRGGTGG